jgi:hypothetical protein
MSRSGVATAAIHQVGQRRPELVSSDAGTEFARCCTWAEDEGCVY